MNANPAPRPTRFANGRPLVVAVLLALSLRSDRAAAQVGAVTNVHDPAIVRAGDFYYVFCTGDGIPIRRSRDLVSWERVGSVFREPPAWARDFLAGKRSLWAPDIRFADGRFWLYYSASSFGSNHSAIGLATNETLDPSAPNYKWVDHGMMIESRPRLDRFNAIDPQSFIDAAGRAWLAFGSFWDGIELAPLDSKTGRPTTRPTLIASRGGDAIEAPFVFRHGEFYYLFASFDLCCRGDASTYNVRVGRSKEVAGPYLDRDGRPMLKGGGTVVLEGAANVRGPGHCAILADAERTWFVHHFYDADRRGVATLQVRPLTWTDDGWPIVGAPITGPQATTTRAAR